MYKKSNKRQLQAEHTKREIFKYASKLFREKGYNNVTIEEITEAAGLSVGSFYHHFKNKQEIIAILYYNLDEFYDEYFNNVLLSEKFSGTTTLHRLKEFTAYELEVCVSVGIDYIMVVYPYMHQNSDFADAMNNRERSYFKIVRSLLVEGQAKGEIRSDISVEQMVTDLTMLTRGCIIDWGLNHCSCKISDWGKSLVNCYCDGIAAR